MPSAVKRQKLSTTRSASSSTRSRGLDAFTKVSKGNSVAKPVSEKKHGDTIAITILEKHSTITRKRKLVEVDEESDTEDVSEILSAAIKAKLLEERKAKPVQEIPQTPRKPILNTSPQSIETPTKGASTLLDRLFLSSKTPTRSPLNSNSSKISLLDSDTPPSSQDLPTELLDLINLHAAFLTALSLHYAHNGTYSPADLRNLCPNVARAWGKRSVTLEDIRRTLGIMNTQIAAGGKKDPRISQLTLSDYGHGKICIEIHFTGGKVGRIARPVNENLLNEIFVSGLKAPWESRTNDEMTMKEFIANLPMESITTCPSLLKMSPLLAKGQRRLEDLKAGVTIKKETEAKKAQEMATSYTSGTKPTLLERLRQKQQHLSTLPPPPSKEALARKAALQRIEEVAAVLTHLSTSSSIGQTRISFTLPTVLSKIRDSARNPMSKVEGADCVRLLASEIAPEWVNIMKMGGGKMEAVVVNREGRLGEEGIRERVREASTRA